MGRMTYYCKRCRHRHTINSKVGRTHAQPGQIFNIRNQNMKAEDPDFDYDSLSYAEKAEYHRRLKKLHGDYDG